MRRLGFSTLAVDQALYAASNFAIAVAAGRHLDHAQFGRFALLLLVVNVIVTASRGTWHEPDLIDGAIAPPGRGHLLVVLAALASLAAWSNQPLALVSASAIVVVAQDRARYAAIARGAGRRLLAADGAWLAAVAAGAVLQPHDALPGGWLQVWTVGAAVSWAVLAGGPAAATSRFPRRARSRLAFAVDHALLTAATQLASLLAAVVLPVAQFGQLRAAIIVYGPVGILTLALTTWLFRTPEPGRPRPVAGLGRSTLAVASVALLIAITVAALPGRVGELVFGPNWPSSPALLLGIGVAVAAQAVSTPFLAVLKLTRRFRTLVTLRAAAAVALTGGVLAVGRATGSATAIALAYVAVNATLAVAAILAARRGRSSPAVGAESARIAIGS